MKPILLAITLVISLAASSISSAKVQAHEHSHRSEHRLFSDLNLSQTQQQDIAEILYQTKQNNSVFKGEKQVLEQQMRLLMDMPVWDQQAATEIVSQRVEQATSLQLNKARARHQAFNVLTESQQAEFLSQQRDTKNRKDKRKALNIARLEKRLGLSTEQVASIKQIQDEHRSQSESLKSTLKNIKEAEKALIFAPEFDEQAWLSLQQNAAPNKIEFGVAKAHTHFQMLSVLDEEQTLKFAKISDKIRAGKGDKTGKKTHTKRGQNKDQV